MYAAGLKVSDGEGNTDTVQVTVYVGNAAPPEPVIESPESGATFRTGRQVTLAGSATDDGGQVPYDKLFWEVIRHHAAPNEHTQPSIFDAAESTGNNVTFSAPGPEDLRSTNPDGNYLEVRLTATDSQGLQKTVSRDLKPLTTEVGSETRLTGCRLSANGETFKAPRTFLSWEGYGLNVYAPPQRRDGRDWIFRSWSDDHSARHTIMTPSEPETYTATFKRK